MFGEIPGYGERDWRGPRSLGASKTVPGGGRCQLAATSTGYRKGRASQEAGDKGSSGRVERSKVRHGSDSRKWPKQIIFFDHDGATGSTWKLQVEIEQDAGDEVLGKR